MKDPTVLCYGASLLLRSAHSGHSLAARQAHAQDPAQQHSAAQGADPQEAAGDGEHDREWDTASAATARSAVRSRPVSHGTGGGSAIGGFVVSVDGTSVGHDLEERFTIVNASFRDAAGPVRYGDVVRSSAIPGPLVPDPDRVWRAPGGALHSARPAALPGRQRGDRVRGHDSARCRPAAALTPSPSQSLSAARGVWRQREMDGAASRAGGPGPGNGEPREGGGSGAAAVRSRHAPVREGGRGGGGVRGRAPRGRRRVAAVAPQLPPGPRLARPAAVPDRRLPLVAGTRRRPRRRGAGSGGAPRPTRTRPHSLSPSLLPSQQASAPPLDTLPAELQERALLEDLLAVVLGFPGSYVRFQASADDAPGTFLLDRSALGQHADPSLSMLLTRMLPIGSYVLRLNRFVRERSRPEHGRVAHALAASVRTLLDEFTVVVAQLESLFREDRLSMQRAWYYMQVRPPNHTHTRTHAHVHTFARVHAFARSLPSPCPSPAVAADAGDAARRGRLHAGLQGRHAPRRPRPRRRGGVGPAHAGAALPPVRGGVEPVLADGGQVGV